MRNVKKIKVNFKITIDFLLYFELYPLIINKRTKRIFHLHLGFNDVSLLWIVNGILYDILFIKVR